jgi:hypothetical protein
MARITFTAGAPEVQLEYYDPALRVEGAARSFTYIWPGDYGVHDLTVEVQEPAQASTLSITPPLGSGKLGSDGLTYFEADLGPVAPAEARTIELRYEKAGTGLSFEQLQPMQPITRPASPWERLTAWPYWGRALGPLVVVLGVGAGFLLRGRSGSHARKDVQVGQEPAGGASEVRASFCHNCGLRAEASDAFCRGCGTELRRA